METFAKNMPGVQDELEKCMFSNKITAKTLFPGIFSAPFSILHDQIYELIDSGKKKIAIAAPRGIGKTSIARTLVAKMLLFRQVNFAVYLSNSATSAEMQTENIKRELMSNEIVKKLFGNIKLSDSGVMDESFSKKSWVAFGNTLILPRGSGQQVRGLNWSGYRPQLVVIDDLEDKEEVRNEELRFKLEEWFFSDLLKTEDKYGEPCTFVYIDTIKHEDSLLQKLLDASDWSSINLAICDEDFNSYDENYMTTEEIKQEYAEHKEKGLTDLFFMERMNIPISLEDAIFKPEYFKYFIEEGTELKVFEKDKTESIPISRLMTVVIVDPAKTVKIQSADSAIVTVSVDRQTHRIFVRDIVAGKFLPDELYDKMFDSVVRFNARILGVEVTSLHAFISQPIENEMRVRGIYPMYVEIPARGHKEDRVATLAPNYRLGYMYHNQNNCQLLESQLQWFPRSKRWDVMDALAYITYLMDEMAYYFDPEDLGDPDAEYSELEEDEDEPTDEWRTI